MYITWHGQNCFKVQVDKTILLIDPFDPKKEGLKLSSPKADIVVLSRPDKEYKEVRPINDEKGLFLISSPGEFEKGGIFIYAILIKQKNTRDLIFHLEIEQVSIGHLGNLNRMLTEEELEKLNGIDVLMVPVGGNQVLEAKRAIELINQIEPRIVIPMHYKLPGLKEKLDSVDKFCSEIGSCEREILEKLKITKRDLPVEQTKYYVMKVK